MFGYCCHRFDRAIFARKTGFGLDLDFFVAAASAAMGLASPFSQCKARQTGRIINLFAILSNRYSSLILFI